MPYSDWVDQSVSNALSARSDSPMRHRVEVSRLLHTIAVRTGTSAAPRKSKFVSTYGDHEPLLVNGVIAGRRAFTITSRGKLESPAFRHAFTDGENVAECQRQFPHGLLDDHRSPNRYCSCGFYAFHNARSTDYEGPFTLTAIVHGYGRVIAGDRGFKSEKLRIVAAVDPYLEHADAIKPGPIAALAMWYSYTLTLWMRVVTLVVVAALGTGIDLLFDPSEPIHTALVIAVWWTVFPLDVYASFSRRRFERKAEKLVNDGRPAYQYADIKRVRKNYPSIEWFPNVNEMLDAHPITRVRPGEVA